MAAVIAAQNYRLIADRALQHVVLIREGQVARQQALIDGTAQMLGAVSQVPAVFSDRATDCANYLANVVGLNPGRYANLTVLRADGTPRCAAYPEATGALAQQPHEIAASRWFQNARDERRLVLFPEDPAGGTGEAVLLGAYPLVREGAFAGEGVVAIRVDWLSYHAVAGGTALASVTWLIDRERVPHPIGPSPLGALPAEPAFGRLLADREAELQAPARDGTPYAYGSVALSPDLTLLVGHAAVVELHKARDALMQRIAVVGLLLLAGVIAVWIGCAVGVAEPIVRLSRGVGRWREGDPLDFGPRHRMPSEVRRLADVFTEAIRSLRGREAELRAAVAQQELLMQEIHHRVKNNLQIVASLLNLQASRIRQPAAKAEFQAARDRVRALATLHRHLYAEGELHTINMRSFLTELCGQLFQAMGEEEGGRIKLEIEAPELRLSSDQAVPLSLIVTEAVTNAVKYAFPGGRAGHVSVRLTADADTAKLVIQDDGVGIPAGWKTETGTRDGLGIQLIRGFVRQLGATLSVEEGSGTRYELVMPLRRERATAPDIAPQPEGIDAQGVRR